MLTFTSQTLKNQEVENLHQPDFEKKQVEKPFTSQTLKNQEVENLLLIENLPIVSQ